MVTSDMYILLLRRAALYTELYVERSLQMARLLAVTMCAPPVNHWMQQSHVVTAGSVNDDTMWRSALVMWKNASKSALLFSEWSSFSTFSSHAGSCCCGSWSSPWAWCFHQPMEQRRLHQQRLRRKQKTSLRSCSARRCHQAALFANSFSFVGAAHF